MGHLTLDVGFRYITWAVYVAVFLLVVRRAQRTPTRAHRDIALFFGATTLLIVLISAQTLLGTALPAWLSIGIGAITVALPYLLLRLVAGFAQIPAWVPRLGEAGLAGCVLALVVTPAPSPPAVVLLLVAYFLSVATFDTVVFVREAMRSAGVTRRRMQAIALGSFALAGAVVAAVLAMVMGPLGEVWTIVSRLFALASGLAYYVGFSPPAWLRRTWQSPALRAFLGEITRLPYLPDLRSVLTELEAHITAVIGAPSAAIGLWQEPEGVLRFWRGLGPRQTPGRYPDDLSTRGFAPHDGVIDVRPERLFSGHAFLEQRPFFSADVHRDDPENASLYTAWDVHAVLAAPITSRDQRLGIVTVWSPRAPVFAESDLELVQLVAYQAAAVLESRRLLQQVAEAQARVEADRLKDSFLASMSHDLRNPLTAVAATAQLLRRRLDREGTIEPDRLRASVTAIETSTTQMTRLIDQLLDYARLQLTRPLDLNSQPTDLLELTRQVVSAHETSSERHTLVVQTAEPALVGVWDRDRIERVLQNLLSNAIKYSPAGGEIVVGLRRDHGPDQDWAVVTVQDHGLGIPAADLPHVFQRFHRASNASGHIAGTGIGLATARQVVEQHGGSLTVESEEGRGSTFTMRLLLRPGVAPAPSRPEPQPVEQPAPASTEPGQMIGLTLEGELS